MSASMSRQPHAPDGQPEQRASDARLLDIVAVGVMVVDAELVVHAWNHFMEMHTGISAEFALGERLEDLLPCDRIPVLRRKVGNVLRLGHYEFIDARVYGHVLPIRNCHALDTRYDYIQQSCTIVPFDSPQGGPPRVCISITDDTHIVAAEQELRRVRRELEKANRTDALTGILNRATVLGQLNDELLRAARYKRPLSVALLDIDHFKMVNDEYGHLAGDAVLREVAGQLQTICRASDAVGRYGGEEFLAILTETDASGAAIAAERFRAGIDALQVPWNGRVVCPTCSFGVTEVAPGEAQDLVLQRADEALYRAKDGGRNRVELG